MRRSLAVSASLALMLAVATAPARADVDPPLVEASLAPGESLTVTKTVDVPPVPPKLDLVLTVDLSGSYDDDLPVIKAKAPDIFNGVRGQVADSTFGLTTFVDYPYTPWGSEASGDYPYALDQDLTSDEATWVAAVNAMSIRFGGDNPESQLEALYQMATGAGRTIPGSGGLGEIAPGLNPSFRADATKVVALTTDAPMHVAGDSNCTAPTPCPFPYPGPSFADTVTALNDAGIKVIAIKAPGATTQMDDLAAATGGAVTSTGATSQEIVEAIVDALEELTFTVTGQAVGCDPLDVSFDPASHSDVPGGTSVQFEETISVPPGTEPGEIHCTVQFFADDSLIGEQEVSVTVLDVIPPEASCTETTNPHGRTTPPAGQRSPGQNEDGFYVLNAHDDHDPDPQIFVEDTGSGHVFGPFDDGTRIKYTQAPGATPSQRKMGSTNGQAGAVDWHLKGKGDAEAYAVDAAGNESERASCRVPPPPK